MPRPVSFHFLGFSFVLPVETVDTVPTTPSTAYFTKNSPSRSIGKIDKFYTSAERPKMSKKPQFYWLKSTFHPPIQRLSNPLKPSLRPICLRRRLLLPSLLRHFPPPREVPSAPLPPSFYPHQHLQPVVCGSGVSGEIRYREQRYRGLPSAGFDSWCQDCERHTVRRYWWRGGVLQYYRTHPNGWQQCCKRWFN